MSQDPSNSLIWADLVRNLGLVVVLVTLWSYIADRLPERATRWRTGIMGLVLGGGTIVAMSVPITIAPGVIFDLRTATQSTAAFFGGPLTALISLVMAALYRFHLGGVGAWPGIAGIVAASVVGVAGHALRRGRPAGALQLLPLALVTTLASFLSLFLLPEAVWRDLLPKLGVTTYAIIFLGTLVLGIALLESHRHAEFRDRAIAGESRLRLVAANLPGFLFVRKISAEGRMWHSYVSPGIARILGTTPTEIAANPGLLRELVHPDDLPHFDSTLRQAADQNAPMSMRYRARHRDGRWRWLQCHATPRPWKEGVVAWDGIVLDVTEQVEAELKLAQSEQRFHAIFDGSFQMMALLDPAGTVLEVNRTALEAAGVRLEEVLGQPVWQTPWWQVDAAAKARLQDAIGRAAEGETVRRDVEVCGEGGRRIALDFSLKPILDGTGKVTLVVAEGRDISERKRMEDAIAHLARHDPLTELPNRRAFQADFEGAHARADRGQGELALLLIDLDRFKVVNDQLGHQVGDKLLIEVGRRLRASVRAGDLVARLGGDEFAVLAEGAPGSAELTDLPERILRAIAAPLTLEGALLEPSCSLGMARFPEHGRTPEELFARADRALYAAKTVGHGQWRLFADPIGVSGQQDVARASRGHRHVAEPQQQGEGSAVQLSWPGE